MAAPTKPANVKKALANSGPSTHGTKQTLASAMQMSAFGGEADMMQTSRGKLFQFDGVEKCLYGP
jgi:hypothetical protein